MSEVEVIPPSRVVEALEGPYAGQRTSGRMWRRSRGPYGEPAGFCCLGVMAEMAGVPREDFEQEDYPGSMDGSHRHLFEQTFPWAYQEADGAGGRDLVFEALAKYNDSGPLERQSFENVVDYIKRNLIERFG